MEDFRRGTIYLIEEERLNLAPRLFLELVKDRRGLIITRQVLELFDHSDQLLIHPHFRMSQDHTRPDNLSPHNIPQLSRVLIDFLDKDMAGVILLDGLEYFYTQNDFGTLLRFMQYLYDRVSVSKSVMLVSINASAFDRRSVHLLRRESSRPPDSFVDNLKGIGPVLTTKARP